MTTNMWVFGWRYTSRSSGMKRAVPPQFPFGIAQSDFAIPTRCRPPKESCQKKKGKSWNFERGKGKWRERKKHVIDRRPTTSRQLAIFTSHSHLHLHSSIHLYTTLSYHDRLRHHRKRLCQRLSPCPRSRTVSSSLAPRLALFTRMATAVQ